MQVFKEARVVFRAPIVKAAGWEFKEIKDFRIGEPMNLGSADVIDLNNSGTAETDESPPEKSLPSLKSPRAMVDNLLFEHVKPRSDEVKDTGFYEFRYREPVLSTSLSTLEEIAKDSNGIVDETNYPGLHIQVGGVDWQGARVYSKESSRDFSTYNVLPDMTNASSIHDGFNLVQSPQTSMQALVHKLAPNNPSASWHIDLQNREFFITVDQAP